MAQERSDYQNRLRDEDAAEISRRAEIAAEQRECHDDFDEPSDGIYNRGRGRRNDDRWCDCY